VIPSALEATASAKEFLLKTCITLLPIQNHIFSSVAVKKSEGSHCPFPAFPRSLKHLLRMIKHDQLQMTIVIIRYNKHVFSVN
jgi:hypothetical protein